MPIRLDAPRHLALLAFLGGSAAIAGALIAQYGFDLAPCLLCHYQRYAHIAALALGLLALGFGGPARNWLLAGAGLAFLAGAGIAGFHVGVEQHWWEGTSGCTAPVIDPSADLGALRDALLAAPVVRCDDIAWSLFGLSMAGYNLLYSVGLALLIFRGLARQKEGRPA